MPILAAVRSSTDSLRQEINLGDRHTLVVDEPEALGGADSAASPYELLAAAVAGCVVITVRMYARRKGWDLGEVGVDVSLDKDAKPQRCTVTLRLPPGLTRDQHERLERIARACPVHRTLEHGLEFDHRILEEVGG